VRVDKLLLLLAGLSVGVAATLVLLTVRDSTRPAAIELVPPPPLPTFTLQSEPMPTATAGLLAVYVTGEVRFPAVYELPPDSLAAAAVEAAGGFTAAADPVAINLARRLADGMQLHVPARAETSPSPSAFSDAPPAVRSAPVDLFAGLVNINSATAPELEALPGIGPSLAARIIAHRDENGPFVSVEALLDVSGIGEAKLEAILDLVTVSP
jgi:competence protein ComEA